MKICKVFVCLLICLFVPKTVYATEDTVAAYMQDLDLQEVDTMTENYLDGTSFSELLLGLFDGDSQFSVQDCLQKCKEMAFGEIIKQKHLVIQLLMVTILAAVLRTVSHSFEGKEVGEMGFYVCYMVLVVIMITTFLDITQAVVQRVGQTADLFGVMLPVFLALAASSGNLTQTALMGPVMMTGCTLIAFLMKAVIVPVLLAAVALEMTDRLSEKAMVQRFAKLLKQGISWGMKGLAGGFMLLLSLQKVGGGVINGLAVRTAKIAVNAVPVVGDVMGGAVDTAAAVAGTLRNGTMVVAVIVLILVCLPLLIKLVVMTLIFKLTAAVAESICEARLVACIGIAGDYTALLLGMVFLAEVMFLFSAILLLGVF